MSIEEFLLRNRKNETKLLKLVDLFWPYFTKMRLFKPDVFLNKNTNSHFMIIEIKWIYQ